MFRVHHGPKRWVNLPYALLMALFMLWAQVDDTDFLGLLPYLVLLPLFTIQLLWPTVAGWAAIVGCWIVLLLVPILDLVIFLHIKDMDGWKLALFGLAPLIPLYIFRPRLRDVRGSGEPEEPSLT